MKQELKKGISYLLAVLMIVTLFPVSSFAASNETGEIQNPDYIQNVDVTGTTDGGVSVRPIITVDTGNMHANTADIQYAIFLKSEYEVAISPAGEGDFETLLAYHGSEDLGVNQAFGFETSAFINTVYGGKMFGVNGSQIGVTLTNTPELPKAAEDYFLLVWSKIGAIQTAGKANYYGISFSLDANGNLVKPAMSKATVSLAGSSTTEGGLTATITPSTTDHAIVASYTVEVVKSAADTTVIKTIGNIPPAATSSNPVTVEIPIETGTIDAGTEYKVKVTAIAQSAAALGDSDASDLSSGANAVKGTFDPPAAPILSAGGATQNSLKLEAQTIPAAAKLQYQIMDRGVVGSAADTTYGSWTDLPNDSIISGLTMNHSYKVKLQFIGKDAANEANYNASAASAETEMETANLTAQTITFAGVTSSVNVTYGAASFTQSASVAEGTQQAGQTFLYSSNATSVANVDGATGEVTIVGQGSATITATLPATATHAGGSASYTIQVARKPLKLITTAIKTYDGSNSLLKAELTSTQLTGIVSTDTVELDTITAAYSSADVHSASPASVTATTLTGADAANYSLANADVSISGTIQKLALTGNPQFTLTSDANGDGVAQSGDVYTATLGTISGTNLSAITQLDIQWMRNGSPISGANGVTYTVAGEDIDQQITVSVKAKDSSNYSTTQPLVSTAQMPGKATIGGTLTFSGSPTSVSSGGSLTLDISALTPVGTVTEGALEFTWQRNGVEIPGATTTTYAIQTADLGTTITAIATAKAGSELTGSQSTGGVPVNPEAPGLPTLSLKAGDKQITGTWTAERNGADVTYNVEVQYLAPEQTAPATTYTYNDGTTDQAITITDSAISDYIFTASGSGVEMITPAGIGGATSYPVTNKTAATVVVTPAAIETAATYAGIDTTYTFTGLTNKVEYTVSVTATNRKGTTGPVTEKATPIENTGGGGSHSGGGGGSAVTKYTVTYDPGEHGTIATKTESVAEGSSPKGVTVKADQGWTFVGWSEDGKTVLKLSDIKVKGDMKLIAVYEEATTEIPSDLKFVKHNEEGFSGKYISGYENADGTFDFRPDANISRAEVATILANTINYKKETGKSYYTGQFPDVAASDWYAEDIGFLTGLNVISGYKEDGTYRPGNGISRAEFVTLVMRIDGLTEANGSVNFSDVNSGDWYGAYVEAATAKGYVAGYDDNTFQPNAPITRAECVTIMNTILGISGDSAEMLFSDVPSKHWAYHQIALAGGLK